MTEKKKNNTRNLAILGGVIVLIIVGLVLSSNKNLLNIKKTISPAEAKTTAENFIKDNLLQSGTQFTVSDAKDYNAGLYELDITIQGNSTPIQSYLTKDGKLFIPQAMDIAAISKTTNNTNATANNSNNQATPVAQAPKSDKPKVELFVMSYCPYGTQMEKGILPVVEALGSKIDFQVKFVNYAMHGQKEVDENMLQYCINTEQNAKYNAYLDCFLKAGDSPTCVKEVGIDQNKANACVAKIDKQYGITDTFNKGQAAWGSSYPPFPIYEADNTKYGVQGSPTLVINGSQINANRDPASLAATICGAFTDGKKPAECGKTFASATPDPGFGTGSAAASGGSAAANCNPTPAN
jgi:hypothetical protein